MSYNKKQKTDYQNSSYPSIQSKLQSFAGTSGSQQEYSGSYKSYNQGGMAGNGNQQGSANQWGTPAQVGSNQQQESGMPMKQPGSYPATQGSNYSQGQSQDQSFESSTSKVNWFGSGNNSSQDYGTNNSQGQTPGSSNYQSPSLGANSSQSQMYGTDNSQGQTYSTNSSQGQMISTVSSSQGQMYGTNNSQGQTYGTNNSQNQTFGSNNFQGQVYDTGNNQGQTLGSNSSQSQAFGTNNNQGQMLGSNSSQGQMFNTNNNQSQMLGSNSTQGQMFNINNNQGQMFSPNNSQGFNQMSGGNFQSQNREPSRNDGYQLPQNQFNTGREGYTDFSRDDTFTAQGGTRTVNRPAFQFGQKQRKRKIQQQPPPKSLKEFQSLQKMGTAKIGNNLTRNSGQKQSKIQKRTENPSTKGRFAPTKVLVNPAHANSGNKTSPGQKQGVGGNQTNTGQTQDNGGNTTTTGTRRRKRKKQSESSPSESSRTGSLERQGQSSQPAGLMSSHPSSQKIPSFERKKPFVRPDIVKTMSATEKFIRFCQYLQEQDYEGGDNQNTIQLLHSAPERSKLKVQVQFSSETIAETRNTMTGVLKICDIFVTRGVSLNKKQVKRTVYDKALYLMLNNSATQIMAQVDPGADKHSEIDPWPVEQVQLANCYNAVLKNDVTPKKIVEPKKEEVTKNKVVPKQAAPLKQEVVMPAKNVSPKKTVQAVRKELPPVEVQIEMDTAGAQGTSHGNTEGAAVAMEIGNTGTEASREETIAAIKILQEKIKAALCSSTAETRASVLLNQAFLSEPKIGVPHEYVFTLTREKNNKHRYIGALKLGCIVIGRGSCVKKKGCQLNMNTHASERLQTLPVEELIESVPQDSGIWEVDKVFTQEELRIMLGQLQEQIKSKDTEDTTPYKVIAEAVKQLKQDVKPIYRCHAKHINAIQLKLHMGYLIYDSIVIANGSGTDYKTCNEKTYANALDNMLSRSSEDWKVPIPQEQSLESVIPPEFKEAYEAHVKEPDLTAPLPDRFTALGQVLARQKEFDTGQALVHCIFNAAEKHGISPKYIQRTPPTWNTENKFENTIITEVYLENIQIASGENKDKQGSLKAAMLTARQVLCGPDIHTVLADNKQLDKNDPRNDLTIIHIHDKANGIFYSTNVVHVLSTRARRDGCISVKDMKTRLSMEDLVICINTNTRDHIEKAFPKLLYSAEQSGLVLQWENQEFRKDKFRCVMSIQGEEVGMSYGKTVNDAKQLAALDALGKLYHTHDVIMVSTERPNDSEMWIPAETIKAEAEKLREESKAQGNEGEEYTTKGEEPIPMEAESVGGGVFNDIKKAELMTEGMEIGSIGFDSDLMKEVVDQDVEGELGKATKGSGSRFQRNKRQFHERRQPKHPCDEFVLKALVVRLEAFREKGETDAELIIGPGLSLGEYYVMFKRAHHMQMNCSLKSPKSPEAYAIIWKKMLWKDLAKLLKETKKPFGQKMIVDKKGLPTSSDVEKIVLKELE